MSELSVHDGSGEVNRTNDDRNRYDDWNDRIETWEQNELTDDHKKLEHQNLTQKLTWNKLTSRSIESVVQVADVRSDRKRQTKCLWHDSVRSRFGMQCVPRKIRLSSFSGIHWNTSTSRKSIYNPRWMSSRLYANESSQVKICNTLGWFCSSQVLAVSDLTESSSSGTTPQCAGVCHCCWDSMFLWTRGKSSVCLGPIADLSLRNDPETSSQCCGLHETCVADPQCRSHV